MSYTKTNWQSGDVISAEKLNKMEDGITSAYTTATSAEAKADSLAETIIDFNNLETVEELGENDKVLVNSGGSVKEADASLIGGSGDGGIFFVNDVNGTLDKTWQEINDALEARKLVAVFYSGDFGIGCELVGAVRILEGEYTVSTNSYYTATSPDDYPVQSIN